MTRRQGITGRDGYIISQALFVASRVMRTEKYPSLSNIEDREEILNTLFPGRAEMWQEEEYRKEAFRLGMKPDPASTSSPTVDARRFLIRHWNTAPGGGG